MALFSATGSIADGQSRHGGPGRGGFGGPASLLNLREVQKELRLNSEQIGLIQQLNVELREKGQTLFQNAGSLSREERDKRFHEFRSSAEKRVAEILEPKQRARLRQIELQQWGIRVVGRPDVQAELKLTEDQKAMIREAFESERTAMQKAFQEFRSGGQTMTDEQRQAAFARYREMRAGTSAKLSAVLTEAQKKQLQAMQGPPFTFPPRRGLSEKSKPGSK